jgi:general stress protein 26
MTATNRAPVPEIDPRFSTPGVEATPWAEALNELREAKVYWLSTVRPDGRPHVTPLAAVVDGGELFFCTGPTERKARNLERNRHVIVTTGCNAIDVGMDIVIEGDVQQVTDEGHLERLADAYEAKYPGVFGFAVRDQGLWSEDGGTAIVFQVLRRKGFAFGKGDAFSQTRWRF